MTLQPEPDRLGGTGPPATGDRLRQILLEGEIELLGRMPWSSNATFLVEACHEDETVKAIYKPRRGEQPLWDFPSGLHQREVAAYELSAALGWDLVPLTVTRDDAPLGTGSVQRFVDADFEQHYFTLLDDERHHGAFRRLCAFDFVANSTDRKSGHVLIDKAGHIWAIDNGLSFHHEFKLRTVIWDFAGEEVPGDVLDDVGRLLDEGLPAPLAALLDTFERDATLTRARALLHERRFPVDTTGRRHPWPLV
jgi:uncharacterized repeat protein (TIGR03843 family)